MFHQAALDNAQTWYEHANGPHGRRISNGALYLVTGSDKGSSWANASYSGASQNHDLSLKLKVAQIGGVNVGYMYSWEHQSPVKARLGPRGDALSLRRDSGMTTAARNQCLFICGFKIVVWEPILPKSRTAIKLTSIVGATSDDILGGMKGASRLFSQGGRAGLWGRSINSGSGDAQHRLNIPANDDTVEIFPELIEVCPLCSRVSLVSLRSVISHTILQLQ